MVKKEIMVVVVVVILIVGEQVAQAQYGPPAEPGRPRKRRCASRCALGCLFRLRLQPVSYMLCFNLCMIKCKFLPPTSLYTCTSSCAHSKIKYDNTEARDVEGYVDSCYNSCKNKH